MKRKNPFAGALLCLLPMIAALVVQSLLSIIIVLPSVMSYLPELLKSVYVPAAYYNCLSEMMNEINTSGILSIAAFAGELGMLILAFLWYLYWREEDRGLKRSVGPRFLAFSLLFGFSFQIIISFVLGLLFQILPESITGQYNTLIDGLLDSSSVWMIVSVAFLAPVAEELIFRGITLRIAKSYFPAAMAIVVQALLFGIMHGNLIQGTYAFLMGLVFGYFAWRLDSVWPSIFMHVFINSAGEVLSIAGNYFENETAFTVICVIVGALGAGGAFALFQYIRKNKYFLL